MNKNFTELAFTENVKKQQEKYGTRNSYARMEKSIERYELGQQEIDFLQARDSFYMATIGENGWPYVQHRGGIKGFVKILDNTTIAYADFRGNGQYISTGNLHGSNKTSIILVNYPARQRLKIWAEAKIITPEIDKSGIDKSGIDKSDIDKSIEEKFDINNTSSKVERIVILSVQAFDWNCPQHITPRYTEDEISRMQQGIL